MVLGGLWRGWSGGVKQSELLRAPRRSAEGGVVGRLLCRAWDLSVQAWAGVWRCGAATGKSSEQGPWPSRTLGR